MTAWEYGYIYVVHTVGPAPAVCVAQDGTKTRVLDGCRGLLRAANLLGADGWLVNGHGDRAACPAWINEMISHIDGVVQGDSMMCYFMHRPVERTRAA